MLKRTWKNIDSNVSASDMGGLYVRSDNATQKWVVDSLNGHSFAASDYFHIDFTLNPGEKSVIYGALKASEKVCEFDYEF